MTKLTTMNCNAGVGAKLMGPAYTFWSWPWNNIGYCNFQNKEQKSAFFLLQNKAFKDRAPISCAPLYYARIGGLQIDQGLTNTSSTLCRMTANAARITCRIIFDKRQQKGQEIQNFPYWIIPQQTPDRVLNAERQL